MASIPAVVALMSWLFLRESISLRVWLLGAIEGEEVFFLSPTGEVRLVIRSIHRPVV